MSRNEHNAHHRYHYSRSALTEIEANKNNYIREGKQREAVLGDLCRQNPFGHRFTTDIGSSNELDDKRKNEIEQTTLAFCRHDQHKANFLLNHCGQSLESHLATEIMTDISLSGKQARLQNNLSVKFFRWIDNKLECLSFQLMFTHFDKDENKFYCNNAQGKLQKVEVKDLKKIKRNIALLKTLFKKHRHKVIPENSSPETILKEIHAIAASIGLYPIISGVDHSEIQTQGYCRPTTSIKQRALLVETHTQLTDPKFLQKKACHTRAFEITRHMGHCLWNKAPNVNFTSTVEKAWNSAPDLKVTSTLKKAASYIDSSCRRTLPQESTNKLEAAKTLIKMEKELLIIKEEVSRYKNNKSIVNPRFSWLSSTNKDLTRIRQATETCDLIDQFIGGVNLGDSIATLNKLYETVCADRSTKLKNHINGFAKALKPSLSPEQQRQLTADAKQNSYREEFANRVSSLTSCCGR